MVSVVAVSPVPPSAMELHSLARMDFLRLTAVAYLLIHHSMVLVVSLRIPRRCTAAESDLRHTEVTPSVSLQMEAMEMA